MTVRERELRAMRGLVDRASRDDGPAELLLPGSVLEDLRSLLPCESVSVFVLDSRREEVTRSQVLDEDEDEDEDGAFFRHYWDCASCSYPDRTGDLETVTRRSDFYTMREFRGSGMWAEYMRQAEFAREMLTCLAGTPGRTVRLVLFRGPGPDFSERERTMLWLLRPHLQRLYQHRAAARSGVTSLTPRQRELLELVAAGHTNHQIARRLGVSESTARKHLEHVFARLRVTSRAAAVARAFPAADPLLD